MRNPSMPEFINVAVNTYRTKHYIVKQHIYFMLEKGEHAVFGSVGRVDISVLGVEMVDRAPQHFDCLTGIDALPEQVARVKVCADHVANCGTKAKKGLGVVNAEAGVHLEGDLLDAVLNGKGGHLV